jgi:hypothetical protein
MRLLLPLRQGFNRTPLKSVRRGFPLGHNFLQFHGLRAAPSDDDQVHPRGKQSGGETEALAAKPLDPIALDGAANPPGDDEAEARWRLGGGWKLVSPRPSRDQEKKVCGRDLPRARLNALELRPLPYAPGAVERVRRRNARQGSLLLLVDGDGEALAPLAASIEEDLLAARSRHAGAKAVLSNTADVVRLVRALHGRLFLLGPRRESPFG